MLGIGGGGGSINCIKCLEEAYKYFIRARNFGLNVKEGITCIYSVHSKENCSY